MKRAKSKKVKCNICGKLQQERGLHSHIRWIHNLIIDKITLAKEPITLVKNKNNSVVVTEKITKVIFYNVKE